MATLNTATLASDLGAYAEDKLSEVFEAEFYGVGTREGDQPITLLDIIERVNLNGSRYPVSRADVDVKVKEASATFSAQDDVVTFNGSAYDLRYMEHEGTLHIDWIQETYLQHIAQLTMVGGRMITENDVPMGAFLIDLIVKKFIDNFLRQALMKGVYSASFAYVDSFPSAVDGLVKVIEDAVTAGDIANVVTTGTITDLASDAYDDFELMGEAIPAELLGTDMFLITNHALKDLYDEEYAATFGGANVQIHEQYKRRRLRKRSRVSIIPAPEMDSENKLILTTRNNLMWITDFQNFAPEIRFAAADPKNISYSMKFASAFGIKRYEQVIVNDQ